MEKMKLSNLQIADVCRQLALLLHAGVGLGDGLYLLAEETDQQDQPLLQCLARAVEDGAALGDAFEECGAFPAYATGLVRVGERVGRTEEALNALGRYYEEREMLDRQVRSALTYPAILLFMMLVVIVVLLTKVLPVFDEVYTSLGGKLTGVAGGLLLLGRWLEAALPVLCAVLLVVLLAAAAFAWHGGFRAGVMAFWRRHWGDRGVSRKLHYARFAQALSMGISSGLELEEAVELAASLMKDVPQVVSRAENCRDRLAAGESLSAALGASELLPPAACRLLTLGLRGGSGDEVMENIARRLADEAEAALQSRVSRVEPTLVLVTSVMVGAILLSVMLPLMHIMTAIG